MIYDDNGISKNTQIYKYPDWNHKKPVHKSPSLNPFDLLSPFLSSWTVGFDRQFDALKELRASSQPTYPPYNIINHKNNDYTIEVAVAGFSKEDIEIELEENKLTISGNKGSKEDVYLHKGIASREFSQTFLLADDVKVVSAELLDGILSISLERVIPDHKKPRKISIE